MGDHVADSLHGDAAREKKKQQEPGAKKSKKPDGGSGDKPDDAGANGDSSGTNGHKNSPEPIAEKPAPKIAAKLSSAGRPSLPPLQLKAYTAKIYRAPRVGAPVPGLYNSIGVGGAQGKVGQLSYQDEILERKGSVVTSVRTTVTASSGESGRVSRSIQVGTDGKKELVLNAAFLDKLPKETKWVSDNGIPLDAAKGGTPLQAYLTMRQMKMMGINYGDLGVKIKKVKMSTIANRKTMLTLTKLCGGVETPATSAQLMQTHSAEYASTVIVQAGAKIISAKMEGGFYESAKKQASPAEMKEFGLKPNDRIPCLFDIAFDVAPFGNVATVPGTVESK